MTLRIEQDFEYIGDDYWSWRAWIVGDEAQLRRVESVRWLLHPSFSPSVVVRTDRSSGFRLETSGWGTFLLRAEVRFENGETAPLRHDLELEYPEASVPTPVSARDARSGGASLSSRPTKRGPSRGGGSHVPREIKTVFLSYGSADRQRATICRSALEGLGIAVTDASGIAPGAPIELAIADQISNADATIAVVSGDIPSTFVAREINASLNAGKPTLVLTDAEPGPLMGVNEGVMVQRFDATNAGGITATLNFLKTQPPQR